VENAIHFDDVLTYSIDGQPWQVGEYEFAGVLLSTGAAAMRKIEQRIQPLMDFEGYAAGGFGAVALADIIANVFKVLNSGFGPAEPH
jgi:hypothetical protein